MRIGIGVTTFNRPDNKKLWTDQMISFCPDDSFIFSIDDTETKNGIVFQKNECLRKLKDYDFVFLFDDDCFPIKEGWADFFIEHSQRTNQHHFIYQHETIDARLIKTVEGINHFNNANGCMMFLTKGAIEKVGAFNEKFGRYGFEHAEYSRRVCEAGLTSTSYQCPEGASEFIYSLDIDNTIDFKINHKPSLSTKEMIDSVEIARRNWLSKIENIYIPL